MMAVSLAFAPDASLRVEFFMARLGEVILKRLSGKS
jgi:hypothetical protein